MQIFRNETEAVIRRFCERGITLPECIEQLDSALAEVIPKTGVLMPELHVTLLTDTETVMNEIELREWMDSLG